MSTKKTKWGLSYFSLLMLALCLSCVEKVKQDPSEKSAPVVQEKRPPIVPINIQIREPAVAGSWYPKDKHSLINLLDKLFSESETTKVKGKILALLSPHAGYSFSGKAAASAFKLLKEQDVRRVVILALSHHVPFSGASIADVTHYRTPLGLIPLDKKAVARLRACTAVSTVPKAHAQEHSLEMQLPLLQRVLGKFHLVPLLLSRMSGKDYIELASALSDIVDENTVVIASSDFTHRGPNYGFEVPDGKESIEKRLAKMDQGALDQILRLDRQGLLNYKKETGATICGINPIALLLELLGRAQNVKGFVLSRYTSGDVMHDWANTVSYVSMAFTGEWPTRFSLQRAQSAGEKQFPLTEEERSVLLRLARTSLEAAVQKGTLADDATKDIPIPKSLNRKAGAFVTLKCRLGPEAICVGRGHGLRGCIGTISPISPIYQTVVHRAASAALEDSRFPHRVQTHELGYISVEVSVLTPPRRVKSPNEIVVGQHGIILSKNGRSATFLPQVAPEQGWDRDTTLSRLAQKAGLSPDDWHQETEFSVYEAIVFSEKE
ncbi:MAG: AmmeMemoRadiSam system protein B [Pseudomonadota bacterium]